MNCLTASNPPALTDNDDKKQLAAIAKQLVHKVRNPLSVIVTAGSQLQESTDHSTDDEDLSYANAIVISADQIEAILRRFSQYACPEPPDFEPVNLNELCRIVLKNLNNEAEDRSGINIEFTPGDNLSNISCDPAQIRVVLADLLENAIYASLPDGNIAVITETIDDTVVVTVEDDGAGITDKNSEKALMPFFTTWPGKSGLGLAIADRIAMAHKGRINIGSRNSRGTRATLSLPLMDV